MKVWRSLSCTGAGQQGGIAEESVKGGHTYSSWVQLVGLSIRWPSFSSLKSSSTGIPGYGEPPSVKISHIKTP